ncbi:MAG: TIGR04255 family protein [Myxococcota bacterium]|nr:TIGR04255 family protein [Myxococcota bacterium]
MIFPEYQRRVFKRNPIVDVTCQLRFPPLLRIAAELPAEMQEVLRPQYPGFQQQHLVPFHVVVPSPGVATPPADASPAPTTLHIFLSEDESWRVTLALDSISLSTTSYQEFPHFLERLRSPLDALGRVYSPGQFVRIGLRYRDVIRRDDLGISDRPWSRLLRQQILGEMTESYLESAAVRNWRLLHLRQGNVQVVLQHGLCTDPGSDVPCYVIDTDVFTEEHQDAENALVLLAGLNREAGAAFHWSVTDELREALDTEK